MPIDKVNPAAAANAYIQTANKVGQGIGVSGADESSFGALIKKAASESIDTIKAGEQASAKAVIGKADLTEVVQAVTAAELTLDTVVALRDRMLQAYQEIMRMPI